MFKIEDMVTLDDEDFLPEKYEKFIVYNDNERIEITGDIIPQNKQITNIASGYMHYFRTDEGLKKFSAFNYKVQKV